MTVESTEPSGLRYQDPEILSRARHDAVRRCEELGRPDLADDAGLVTGELVTNAVLHGGGCTGVAVSPTRDGVRIEVRDASRLPPLLGRPTDGSLTGRGLRLVDSVSARWGAETESGGKVVWAELTGESGRPVHDVDADILAMWDDHEFDGEGDRHFRVELGDVPTDLLLAAKSHVENLVREFALASAGERSGQTAEVPAHMAALLQAVVDRFADARLAIKRQALAAASAGAPRTRLTLDLPASAAEAADEYVRALDEIDAYCRARRMLTLETPEQHRAFRRWYVEELVESLRAASEGRPPYRPQSFEDRLLSELDRVAAARRVAERSARLYSVAAALAMPSTPEAVSEAVLNEGLAALGAAAGGVLLAVDDNRLALPGAVGYDESVLARLRAESRDAELPAAEALRTGRAVWLESPAERDERFPELVRLEESTVALCAVPLEVQGRRLGALRFSFKEARLFDEDERRFVLALAAQTAQALERARLQQARVDVSRRLQRSLLPPRVPEMAGIEVAAIYQPFGDEMDVGGDFYDIWTLQPTCWAIAIGDAAGTGPEAAALTALARHTLRALTLTNVDASDTLRILNTALVEAAVEVESERFCTALLGIVSVGDHIEIELATGGHPPPILRRADGTTHVLDVRGSLLGLFTEIDVGMIKTRLGPGDTLVAVTDGVLEARREGTMFEVEGVQRILGACSGKAGDVAAALERAVLDHTGGSLTDDMAAIVLHVPS